VHCVEVVPARQQQLQQLLRAVHALQHASELCHRRLPVSAALLPILPLLLLLWLVLLLLLLLLLLRSSPAPGDACVAAAPALRWWLSVWRQTAAAAALCHTHVCLLHLLQQHHQRWLQLRVCSSCLLYMLGWRQHCALLLPNRGGWRPSRLLLLQGLLWLRELLLLLQLIQLLLQQLQLLALCCGIDVLQLKLQHCLLHMPLLLLVLLFLLLLLL
jgi:hypothetical protein